ncbi:MAG TPA: hypothetical protein VD902_00690 [Symbiobacteriaceae bacterium]|nr:hypothetical protein [Symbiobacteriaceae bacterium]
MQEWDRVAMIAVGLLVSCHTAYHGWKFWKKRRYLAVAGTVLLVLSAVGVPIALAVLAT